MPQRPSSSPAPGPAAAADGVPPLLVTELAPDHAGSDHFEYIEVTNTTDAPVDLASEAALAYTYADSDDRSRDVPLAVTDDPAVDGDTVLAARGTAVLWLSYTSGNVDSYARTEQDFRDFWAGKGVATAGYPLLRVTGQAGMANGGDRGIRVSAVAQDATQTEVSRSFYPAGSVAADRTVHFGVPAAGSTSARVTAAAAAPTAGAVAPEQLAAPEPEPTPEPTEPAPEPTEPSGEPTPEPTEPTQEPTQEPTPEPTPGPTDPGTPVVREPDPDLVTAPLQVTELVVDSTNVGSGDGYEFVEVYNATSRPVPFADHVLSYLYPLEDLTNSSTVLWPSQPADFTIPAGGTVVFWVKNGQNDALTAADFNAFYGTDLAAGTELVEIHQGGMANGSARGLQIQTRTGHPGNRAYYNLAGADDVDANRGIQFGPDPQDLTRQVLLGKATPTPGTVGADQVPAGLMVPADDAAAPAVEDTTEDVVTPGEDFEMSARITDDVEVRRVTLEFRGDRDTGFRSADLVDGSGNGTDRYAFTVAAADLTGKRSITYRFTVSDGVHTVTTDDVTVPVAGVSTDPVRLDVADGEHVRGTVPLVAAGDAYPRVPDLAVDGEPLTTTPSLESAPVFAFEAGSVDTFFRNGVKVGDEVLRIFDDGIYTGYDTIDTAVPLSLVHQGEELVVSVWAGTKAAPEIDENENNDDFWIRDLRLVLPDGRTLTPQGYAPGTQLNMGDSAGKLDYYDARFVLPDDAFTGVAHDWDTTAVADGPHTVTAHLGADTASATVVVDNTAPQVTTSVADGETLRGEFTLDAEVTDAGSGVAEVAATLDGEAVTLPHAASSVTLPAGVHELAVTATDQAGNEKTTTVTFTTPVEAPDTALGGPADGAEVTGDVTLSATATDPSGDALRLCFAEGYRYDPTDAAVTVTQGTTRATREAGRDGDTLTAEQLAALAGTDGLDVTTTSDDAFPFQLFEVAVPEGAGDDARVRVAWSGSANADAKVLLHVRDAATGAWQEVDRHVTAEDADGRESFELGALVPVAGHVEDGVVTVLVQHSEGFAGEDLSTRDTAVTPHHEGDTARWEYDFTLAWESDTQYYNETPEYYEHQLGIHRYLLDRRDELNLQYLFHTGDIVNVHTEEQQWAAADAAYDLLDEAGLPYGVLAGNHDVGHKEIDYTAYGQHFGAERYEANPWYGGTYADNRGHYDLFTAGGVDFVAVYMGWGPGDDEIAWMNEVLARYPERVAVVDLHEYMLTTGGLGPIPQRVYDEVVATNPNVRMVMSGHYHDAFTRYDTFDDDGDGVAERTVTQMLFDYQGLPEGGQGYLRLLHFDNETGRMIVRTYSPTLDDYDSTDPSLDLQHQEFTVPYATLGITVRAKELATDSFRADVLTTHEIGCVDDVASGEEASVTWADVAPGTHGWYVTTTDPYGAVDVSEVREVVVTADPQVSLGAAKVHAGSRVEVTGSGLVPGRRVRIELTTANPTALGEAVADRRGRFTTTVTVPPTTKVGAHEVRLVADGEELASAPLRVVGNAGTKNGKAGR